MSFKSKKARGRIRRCLLRWQDEGTLSGKVVPKHLESEAFLPVKYMVVLLRMVYDHYAAPISQLEDAFVVLCRTIKRKGGRVRLSPMPSILGQAVDREVFEDRLFKLYQDKPFIDPDDVTDFVEDLIAGKPPTGIYAQMAMNLYDLAWATWECGGDQPFSFRSSNSPDEVRASLGLDLLHKGMPLLLLEYERPTRKLDLYRPTIADAELFHQFDPPLLETKAHGYTRPWPKEVVNGFDPNHPPPWEPVSRPEGVHRRSWLGLLVRAPKELK